MKEEKIININGIKYNASTGEPVSKNHLSQKNQPLQNNNRIKNVQSINQKSRTIHQQATGNEVHSIGSPVKKVGRSMDIARSKNISHFTPKPIVNQVRPSPSAITKRKSMDLGPIRHPMVKKIQTHATNVKNISLKTIKESAITEALNSPTTHNKKNSKKRTFKFIHIFIVSLSLILLFIYAAYQNLPIISVKMASAQAGINATYPEYRPDGYSLNGPVVYSNGEVVINFKANTGKTEFSIRQSKSSWDSSAVKEKINKDLNGEFMETHEKGLTIFTYGGKATWVNGGILYNITGDAPLNSDQIRRIATSL